MEFSLWQFTPQCVGFGSSLEVLCAIEHGCFGIHILFADRSGRAV
jgi:hypothetical protein